MPSFFASMPSELETALTTLDGASPGMYACCVCVPFGCFQDNGGDFGTADLEVSFLSLAVHLLRFLLCAVCSRVSMLVL